MNEVKDMEIFIKKIINKVIEESNYVKKDRCDICIILGSEWNNKYYVLLDELKSRNELNRIVVIIIGDNYEFIKSKIDKYLVKIIIKYEDYNILENTCLLFPVISRNDIINIASCINSNETTNLVKLYFEAGQKIYILKSGLEKFTNKEPNYYKEKILSKYKEIIQMDIEIICEIKELL